MCRWLAYVGEPLHPSEVILDARHSLVAQSLDSPLGAEIRALGFEVDARAEPRPYRELRRPGVQVARVDPRDDDLVAAVRQPSATSLPWVLDRLVRGRRPA